MERMTVEIVGPDAPSPRRGPVVRALAGPAIVLVTLGLWTRGSPEFVAWEMARDHHRCFGRRHLPARVWSNDPEEVRDWLESRGTPVPPLPAQAGEVEIAGARYCPLLDRVAAHVYYGGDHGPVSLFVVSGPVRVGDGWAGRSRGLNVRLLRAAGRVLAVVGENAADVEAVTRAFLTSVA
jgi:hypothetical protein